MPVPTVLQAVVGGNEHEFGKGKPEAEMMHPPGHSSSSPISISGAGRVELGRMILAIAVVWLTMKIKIKEVAETLYSKEETNTFKIVALAEGVKYQDTDLGGALPVLGDALLLQGRAFHNGLELQDGAVQLTYMHGTDDQELQGRLPACLPGLARATAGMRLDGKRQVALTCKDGFPPYVPKGGVILCSVVLSKTFP